MPGKKQQQNQSTLKGWGKVFLLMPLFRSPQGIGRGETAESRLEFPFFAAFMAFCAIVVLAVHVLLANPTVTIALGVSMFVFAVTVIRVEYGVAILVVATLLSPEIDLTGEPVGSQAVNIRYNDLLIGVIFLGVIVKMAFEGRTVLWRPSAINAAICAYFGICIISTLLAVRANLPAWDRRLAFFVALKMIEFYMIFFLVGNAVHDLRTVRRQTVLFLIVAMIVCVYSINMIRTVDRVGTPFEAQGAEPNTLGGYLMIVMCVGAGLFTQAPRTRTKLALLLVCAMTFIPFLYTLSRASYVALIVAFSALGVMSRRTSILGAVALTLILSPILMPDEVKDRVNYTFQRGTGEKVELFGKELPIQVDKSTGERVYVWQKVKFLLTVAPWFGGGLAWEKVLDSQYARVIMETGLFGLAAFLYLQLQLVRTCRQASRWATDWFGKGLALGVTACVIGLIVHALGTISFLIIRIMEPFWFLVALTVVIRACAIEDHTKEFLEQRRAATQPQHTVPAPASINGT